MNDSSSHSTTASGRPRHRAVRRSAVVATVLVLIVGAPLVARALADDSGTSVPTGATVVSDRAPVDARRSATVAPTLPADAEIVEAPDAVPGASEDDTVPEDDSTDAAAAAPPLDIHAVLTHPYSWDERSLRVAALEQVLNVNVDGWYDADTRRVHLEFLEFADLSTDGVPDEAPPGPSAEEWAALRDCESGGDYSIVSSSGRYRGAYQFARTTWDNVAERNNPALIGVDPEKASPVEQDAMAAALYREAGAGPWPVCGRHLS